MKRITEISKESLDGKFVFATIEGSAKKAGIVQVYFDPEHTDPTHFYLKQNFTEGSNAGPNNNFQYGWSKTGNEILWELPEAFEAKLKEKEEALKALREGDVVFYRSRWREIEVYREGEVYAGGDRLTIMDDWLKRENPEMTKKEALQVIYTPLLNSPDIPASAKEHIQRHIDAEVVYTSTFTMNNGIDVTLNSRNSIVAAAENSILSSTPTLQTLFGLPGGKSIGWIPISFIEFLFFTSEVNMIENQTFFTEKFKKQVELITCDEKLKEYMLSGNFYHKMQFIDFDIQTQMISFTPKGKEIIIENGTISSKNRQTIKVHKFFNTVLKATKAAEYDIKCFADKLISFYSSYEVKYFKGKKLAENYSKVNTRDWTTKSCMDRKAENFFDMYTSSRFRLGVIYREGEVVGRFIEVTADMGFVYNDRLYYKDEMVVAWYNSWVDSKKLHRKAFNDFQKKKTFYHVDKGNYDKTIFVTLPKALDSFAIYPYLDTLSYGVGKTLTNEDNERMRFEFQDQYGKCKRLRCQLDVITQKYIDNNEAVEIKFGANAGNYTTVDNLIYSVKNGGHCLK